MDSALHFKDRLEYGLAGESEMAQFFNEKGYDVIPVYEKIYDSGKGPRMFMANFSNLVAPDMQIYKASRGFTFIEAKTKSGFVFHRHTKSLRTGINLRHWNDYKEVFRRFNIPFYIMFIQKGVSTKDFPENMINPSGLYGQSMDKLILTAKDSFYNEDPYALVYWDICDLVRYADYPFM